MKLTLVKDNHNYCKLKSQVLLGMIKRTIETLSFQSET